MTVADLITRGMFDLSLLQEGEVPTAQQIAMGLSALNDWLDGLPPDTLTLYVVTRSTWNLTSAANYTVGVGGDVNIVRPVSPQAIQNIGYLNNNFSPAVEIQLGPVLTDDSYAAIPIKTYSSPYPTSFYYNPTFPLGTLKPWPIPSSSNLVGVLYAGTPTSEFTSTTQSVSVPNGYRRYFRTHLAMELAPVFSAQPSAALVKMAADSEAAIKSANVRMSDLTSDAIRLFQGRARSNIYTGQV